MSGIYGHSIGVLGVKSTCDGGIGERLRTIIFVQHNCTHAQAADDCARFYDASEMSQLSFLDPTPNQQLYSRLAKTL